MPTAERLASDLEGAAEALAEPPPEAVLAEREGVEIAAAVRRAADMMAAAADEPGDRGWRLEEAPHRLDRPLAIARQAVERLADDLRGPRVSDGFLASDIRRHLPGMPVADRVCLLRQAVEAGDGVTVAAALRAPLYLTGIGDDEAETIRDAWSELHRPGLAIRLAGIRAAVDFGARAHRILTSLKDLPA